MEISLFDQIVRHYQTFGQQWESGGGIEMLRSIFFPLAIIQLSWLGIIHLLKLKSAQHYLVETLRNLIFISLTWWVISHYSIWMGLFIKSVHHIGGGVVQGVFNPGDIADKGVKISIAIFKNIGLKNLFWNPTLSMGIMLMSLFIVFMFLHIAVEMVILMVGAQLILVGGTILLAISPLKFLRNYSERFYATMISFAVRFVFMILMIGLGVQFLENISDWYGKHHFFIQVGLVAHVLRDLMQVFLIYMLTLRVPVMAASMLTGDGAAELGGENVSAGSLIRGVVSGVKTSMGAAKWGKDKWQSATNKSSQRSQSDLGGFRSGQSSPAIKSNSPKGQQASSGASSSRADKMRGQNAISSRLTNYSRTGQKGLKDKK